MRRCAIIAGTLVVSSLAALASPDSPDAANKKGLELFNQARYAEAEQEHRKSVEYYRNSGPENAPFYAVSLNNLTAALQAQGKAAEAQELMKKVISLEKQLGHYCDPLLIHALNNLALMHHLEANLGLAANLLQKALKISKKEGIDRAGTLHNLGAVYFDMGKRRQAEELMEEALAMNLRNGGETLAPSTYTYLARIAAMRGDMARAESLMQKALDIRRRLNPGHPNLAVTLGDIGELEKDAKRYDKAREQFDLALELLESLLGRDHLHAAPILFQYGETYRLQGKYKEALSYYERVIPILLRSFGPQHSRLATVYGMAAIVSKKLKLKDDANDYNQRASAIVSNRVDYRRHTIDASAFLPNK